MRINQPSVCFYLMMKTGKRKRITNEPEIQERKSHLFS